MKKQYDDITTKAYFRRGFNRVILVTFAFIMIPILLMVFVQGGFHDNSALGYISAEDLIGDYRQEKIDELLGQNASVMIVLKDLSVLPVCGENIYNGSSFSEEKWADFLLSSSEISGYRYDIAYDEIAEQWIVIRYPRPIQFIFALDINANSLKDRATVGVFVLILSTYVIALIIFVFVYGNRKAHKITKEIKEIADFAEAVENGNYDLPLEKGGTVEIKSLKKALAHMASEIQKKESLQKEEEAKRMLLVSEISHDLKNPLAGVQGYSEMLLESGCVDTEKQKDYAARIFNNSVRANKLLDSLFTYSKLGSTEYVPAFEKTDICEFTRQVFAEAISRFEDKHFTYQLDLPEEEIFVKLNKDLFRRVYDNLMENSIKYNPEGTTFFIKMELEDSVKIYIFDNGVGIGDTEVDRLFEPFVRGRQSGDASKNEGSGLGLAIVKQIVELHQGTIEYVKEDAPGCKYLICLARKM